MHNVWHETQSLISEFEDHMNIIFMKRYELIASTWEGTWKWRPLEAVFLLSRLLHHREFEFVLLPQLSRGVSANQGSGPPMSRQWSRCQVLSEKCQLLSENSKSKH